MRYSTREAGELLGLSARQVRSYAHAGFLAPERGPRGEFLFTFQDIVLIRTAKELVAARIDPRAVRRALRKLKQQLPNGRPLTAVRISARADKVLVRDEGTTWHPESGQVQFDFGVGELVAELAPLARERARQHSANSETLDADDWFDTGYELEALAPDEAKIAYRKALELDPDHAAAAINLGRLYQEDGLLNDAEAQYRRALCIDEEDATAAFNLGTVLEDLGRDTDALDAYKTAIRLDRSNVDAHHNLARLYEKSGHREAALRHLHSVRSLRK